MRADVRAYAVVQVARRSLTEVLHVRWNTQGGRETTFVDSVRVRASLRAHHGVFAGGSGTVRPGVHFEFNALDGVRVQTVGSNAEMPRRGLLLDATVKISPRSM